MKVADGFWLSKKGYEVNYASQAYKVETTENAIKVLATPYTVMNRGMTLGGPNLEITYSSTCENTIKVHIDHYRGGLDNIPRFELNEDPNFKPVINRSEDSVELISGDTKVVIRIADDWDVQFYYKDRHLTGGAWRSTSIIHENQFHANARMELQEDDQDFNYPQDPNRTYIREQLKTDIGECIYGFGEKFTPFVKNGQVVEIWNSDGGTCSDQSYKNIPFYVSSKSYGVFVNSSDKVSFEVNSDTVSKVTFTQPGEELEYFIIGGENLEDVLKHYTDLTGKPSLPPAYTFGLWLSTSFTTSYDEETVTSFIDGMKDRKIPLQVFHFDCFWMKEYEWCNFEWDKDMFPDPEGLLKRLHDRGLEICVWINSYVGQQSKLFDIGKEKGYFIKNLDGSVYQSDMWQPGMAIVDFTNPEACEWFKGLLKKLFDMGVNNIKTDFGERIPTKVKYFNGKDPIKMHNYYTYLYNKCVFEALEEYYGKDKACLFARSATVGGQKFPVHWGGDCYAEYSAMSETLRGGLSLCSSGFGFFSHDMGGFEATAPADVYKRWCAFGLLSTHSRLHGSTSYRVPWVYDEDGDTEACDVLRHYTVLKGRLMPYLWAQANKTHTEGVPMMRSMIIAFSDDTACKYLDQQYMLGDNLCIVPVMNEEGIAEFYVPDNGTWTDIQSGETYEGGKYYTRKCDYFQTPILARPNSIVTYGNFDAEDKMTVVYDYLQDAEAVVYGLEDGKTAQATIFDSESNKITDITATRNGNVITVSYAATDKSFKVTAEGKTVEAKTGSTSVEITL
jgi:alpha-D-xyloside xylohydrolase